MSRKVSIIIPIHNQSTFTKNCLNDLLKLPNNFELIIVNNASTDNSIDVIKEQYILNHSGSFLAGVSKGISIKNVKNSVANTRRITTFDAFGNPSSVKSEDKVVSHDTVYFGDRLILINNQKNEGFAIGSNIGFAASTGDYIIFLNNDIKVQSDFETWPQAILNAIEDGSLAGPTGGLLDSNLNFKCETNKYIDSPYFYLSGWCLAGKRETFNKLINYNRLKADFKGPFEEMMKTYWEDDDLSFRSKQLGIQLKIVPVPVRHYGKGTSKKMNVSEMYLKARDIFISKWKDKI